MKIRLLAVATILGLLATTVNADPINKRPITLGSNTFEQTLQQIFDNIWVSGPMLNAATQQTGFAQFTSTGFGGSTATFIIELAGNKGLNTFGIYDAASHNTAQIFSGTDAVGDVALVSFLADGSINVTDGSGTTQVAAPGSFSSPSNFGFYLGTPGNTFFSEDDRNPNGDAQALIYQGGNGTHIAVPGFSSGEFTADEFIIAWEDLVFAGSDQDFNDMVLIMQSLIPVPAPAAVLLGMMGLGMVGWMKRRFRSDVN